MYLTFLGLAVCTLAGATLTIVADELLEKAIGLVVVAFFGGIGAKAAVTWVRGEQQRVAVSRTGLEIYLPGVGWRLVPWSDVEWIGVVQFAGQEFTAVRLRDYEALLASLTPEQSRAAARSFAVLGLFVQASALLLRAPQLLRLLRGSEAVKDLRDVLAFGRAQFGAELLFGWAQRDRSAAEFAAFLERFRRASSGAPGSD